MLQTVTEADAPLPGGLFQKLFRNPGIYLPGHIFHNFKGVGDNPCQPLPGLVEQSISPDIPGDIKNLMGKAARGPFDMGQCCESCKEVKEDSLVFFQKELPLR